MTLARFTLLPAAVLSSAVLVAACASVPRPDEQLEEQIDGAVGDLPGVTKVEARCGYEVASECGATVRMDPDAASKDRILAVMSALEKVADQPDLGVTLKLNGEARWITMSYVATDRKVRPCAEALAHAATTDDVSLDITSEVDSVMTSSPYSEIRSLTGSVGFSEGPYSEALEWVDTVTHRCPVRQLRVKGGGLEITTGTGKAEATDELALVERLARRYGIAWGSIVADRVELQLPRGADIEEATAYAKRQPEHSRISVVDLAGPDDQVSLEEADAAAAPRMKRIVDVLRRHQGFVRAEVGDDHAFKLPSRFPVRDRDKLRVNVVSLDDAVALHGLLADQVAADYDAVAVAFQVPAAGRAPRMTLGAASGQSLRTDLVGELTDQGRWGHIAVRSDALGARLSVETRSEVLREVVADLAQTALATEETWVELAWGLDDEESAGDSGRATFVSGGAEIEPTVHGSVDPDDEIDVIRDGWKEGFTR